MAYKTQINIKQKDGSYKWMDCKSSEGRIYKYKTEEEAKRMLKICYPEQTRFNDFSLFNIVYIEN